MTYEITPNGDGFALIHPTDGDAVGSIRHFDTREEAEIERCRLMGLPHPELGPTAFYPSEAAKYLSLTLKYLHGNGLDIGSGGWPVTERAIQYELPPDEFNKYTGGRKPQVPIEWHGDMFNLPFKDDTLDFIHASHLIEDFSHETWAVLFKEWARAIKPTGFIIILVPEVNLWAAAIARGQPPNCSHHAPEPSLGDVSAVAVSIGLHVVEERMTALFENDYSILAVLSKQ